MSSKARNTVSFYLNGERQNIGPDEGGMMLADFLRYRRSLTGTKIVCAEGDCGACTVLKYDPYAEDCSLQPVNSCIYRVAQMDGTAVITVEALAEGDVLSQSQQAMVNCHGGQCGFCTPGFVMALAGLAEERVQKENREPITSQEAKNALTGNLCRCTGYQPILEAAQSIALAANQSLADRYMTKVIKSELRALGKRSLLLSSEQFVFFAPTQIKDATHFLKKNPDAKILAAGTDLGVWQNKGRLEQKKILSLQNIKDLHKLEFKKNRVIVGANVPLSRLRQSLKDRVPEVARFLDRFASPQIKNVATLVGNLANASPIAECPPFLLALNSLQRVVGPSGSRKIKIEDFFIGYRKTALKSGELITHVEFEIPAKEEEFSLFKISQRVDLDISSVNAAFRMKRIRGKVHDLRIAYGGVAAIPLRLQKTENLLRGSELSPADIEKALAVLHTEITPISDLRGSAAFRRVISENLFNQFFVRTGKR